MPLSSQNAKGNVLLPFYFAALYPVCVSVCWKKERNLVPLPRRQTCTQYLTFCLPVPSLVSRFSLSSSSVLLSLAAALLFIMSWPLGCSSFSCDSSSSFTSASSSNLSPRSLLHEICLTQSLTRTLFPHQQIIRTCPLSRCVPPTP